MDYTQSVIQKVKVMFPGFSEKEKKVANYLIQAPDQMIHDSISQLAERLFISEATITRFTKHIGFKGYQALKIALASDIRKLSHQEEEQIAEDASVTQIFSSSIQQLQNTLTMMDENKILTAVSLLADSTHIAFYGNGASSVIALDAHHKFLNTGISSNAYLDFQVQHRAAFQLKETDVACVISAGPIDDQLMSITSILRERRVPILSITEYGKNNLSQCATVSLFTSPVGNQGVHEEWTTQISQLCLVHTLYTKVMMAKDAVLSSY
ncbi:MurR/RpiR family transcriptional regulator [Priestia koreensis]|uniref:RpiR family transcriptional regulator n=1 Tax=Priestia koreensis TaxID=284581 RepID=A0A0M0L5L1_9BACI|nr:MurR/RpiR family transcriptional regulator [Priestia koreensis]KOO46370.1 hypothetical protein AMD01_11040 [Priestia koreensis]